MGEHISAAHAAAGLARTGVRVVFHSRHARWLTRIKEPNLTVTSQRPAAIAHDLEYDYQHQLRYAASRARWYAGGLHPLLQPARPRVDRQPATRRLPFERYVLLAPCAWHPEREWSEAHWIRLAHLLRETAHEVVAIGHERQAGRLQRMFNDTQVYWVTGHPPEWVMDAMLGAVCLVGIDSGMTHLAALLGVKTIALHSQLKPGFLWPRGTVKSISPEARCVFCRWQEAGGWMSACQKTCSAIASVSPETVLKAVQELATPASSKSPN
jgi:ADP-heptose:LPS heptosyltransferase